MVNPFLSTGQAAAALVQQYDDERKAELMATLRIASPLLSDYGKTFDQLKAEALADIVAKRVEKEAFERTRRKLSEAERRGTQAALAEHATPAQPAPAAHQPEQVKPPPAILQTDAAKQRQADRWQRCVDAGLTMPTDTYGHFPRGIGKVAKELKITHQALSQDLNKHRERLFSK